MSEDSNSSNTPAPRKAGPYEAGLFAVLGLKPSVHVHEDETVARVKLRGEIYEGSSLLGRDAAVQDLLSELPEPVALRVQRHVA